jgi:hypothetical protein
VADVHKSEGIEPVLTNHTVVQFPQRIGVVDVPNGETMLLQSLLRGGFVPQRCQMFR